MRTDPPRTPLLALLRALATQDRRRDFAVRAGTSVGYLYQLAGCYPRRRACGSALALRISAAATALHKRHGTPEISMEQLASMCDTCPPTAATT